MLRRWALCACVALWSAEARAEGPSFDCAKASTVDEHLICAAPYLASIDVRLADAVRVAGVPVARQRQWVSERNRNCGLSRSTDLATLDHHAATDCLYDAYKRRIAEVQASPVQGVKAPKYFPYLPHLTQDRAPEVCRALEAAEQESFKSSSPYVSAIDRAWPGLDVKWVISPAVVSGHDTSNLLLARPADLDADGKPEILMLTGQNHSWRGDMFSLVRFPTEADFETFEARADKAGPGKGESILVSSSDNDDPFPWDWYIPGVLAVNGQYYLLDEGSAWEDTGPATLYRIPAVGEPEPVCTVERRSSKTQDWDKKAGLSKLVSDLTSIAGGSGSGWCGTLDSHARLASDARRIRTQALLRPWATSNPPHNSRRDVDGWLADWATESVWNWELYLQFQAHESEALQSLAGWYGEAFGIADAGQEARRVMDLMVSGHFVFPASSTPEPSPLAVALLKGAPVTEVAPLLETADLGQPDLFEGEVSEEAPLALAVRHPHLVRLLLEAGSPVDSENSFGKTPLMYAAQVDNADSVRLLLAAGAAVNARTRSASSCTLRVRRGDRTALHYAAENAGLELIRLLVEAGADIGARDKAGDEKVGQTPLDYLARNTKLSADDRQKAKNSLSP
ncbi:MAG TPA: ankyrin repeat domain-containing protein [Kaistia sp.]|jgi:uncharacterized protein|nr:ankyrin repeat domain-containing protein [Kaistia sp.]